MIYHLLRGKPLATVKFSGYGLCLLAGLLLASPSLYARSQQPASTAPYLQLAQMDAGSAARLVQSRTGGRVLSVDRAEKNGRVMYRVKVLLPEGRVRTVTVDADSGQMGG